MLQLSILMQNLLENMLSDYQNIVQSPLLKGLSMDEVSVLLSKIHYRIKKYEKEQLIAHEGEVVDRLMIVLSGSVKGEMMDFNGKTIKIEDIYPPKPLAIAFLFGENNAFPVNIIANETSDILIMDKKDVVKLFQTNEVVLTNFLNVISSRSQFLTQKIKMLSFQTIKGKLANYILQNVKDNTELVLDKTQNELAQLFGVARPSIGRAIREMHDEKAMVVNGKNIHSIDKEVLRSYLC